MENKEFWHTPTIQVSMFDNDAIRVTRYYPLHGNHRAYSGSVDVYHDDKDFEKAIKAGSRYIHENKAALPKEHGMNYPLGDIKV